MLPVQSTCNILDPGSSIPMPSSSSPSGTACLIRPQSQSRNYSSLAVLPCHLSFITLKSNRSITHQDSPKHHTTSTARHDQIVSHCSTCWSSPLRMIWWQYLRQMRNSATAQSSASAASIANPEDICPLSQRQHAACSAEVAVHIRTVYPSGTWTR